MFSRRVLGWASESGTRRVVLALGRRHFWHSPGNAALIHDVDSSERPGVAVCVARLRPIEILFVQRCVLMGDSLSSGTKPVFRRLYEERLPYYRQAELSYESSGESIRVVEQILALGIFAPGRRRIPGGRGRAGSPVAMSHDRKNHAETRRAWELLFVLRPELPAGRRGAARAPLPAKEQRKRKRQSQRQGWCPNKGKFRITL